jgi:hypothetical protein
MQENSGMCKNNPIVAAPTHWARCTVSAFVSGRSIDLRLACHDFEVCGFNAGAALVREFSDALLFPSCGPRERLLVRLFRFKMARRWAAFERELAAARDARQAA